MHMKLRLFVPAIVLAMCSPTTAQLTPQNRSRSFAPGTCGPVDPSYIRTAEATGGIPFFFHRTEVSAATKFMMANSGDNRVTVLWAKGSVQGERDFLVPIDSSLSNVIFTLSADNRDTKLEVFDPNNNPVSAPKADVTDFTCGRYLTLKNPSSGSYRLHLTGSGHFWIKVGGKSDIFLTGVEFVELGGRPGHEGMFPIHGEPIAGKQGNFETTVSGAAHQVAFELITPEAQPLHSISAKVVSTSADEQQFETSLTIPREPFRIVVTGVDRAGSRFQRVHEAEFSPSTISIKPLSVSDLKPSQTTILTMNVTNLGSTDKFRVIAICGKGWSTHADRNEIPLRSGESAEFKVTVAVPAGVANYTSADLIVTVTSTGDPKITNSYIQRLSVGE